MAKKRSRGHPRYERRYRQRSDSSLPKLLNRGTSSVRTCESQAVTGSFVQLMVCYGAIVPVKLSVSSNYYPEVTSGDSQ